jgi:hypothetical protein
MPEMNDNDVIGQSRYYTGDEVAEAGPVTVQIKSVNLETFKDLDGKEDTKQVLVFENSRQLTLNATRKNQLKELFGDPLRVSAAKGQSIKLFAEKVNGPRGGKRVNSVQIGKAEGTGTSPF